MIRLFEAFCIAYGVSGPMVVPLIIESPPTREVYPTASAENCRICSTAGFLDAGYQEMDARTQKVCKT